MATLIAWQVAIFINAGFCGWSAFSLMQAKRILAAIVAMIALVAALIGVVFSLNLYTMA